VKTVELVFRSVGERTSDLALQLALKHIQPQKVHILENVRPFSQAVQQMLQISYEGEMVVFMDADCLIFENLRPFLESNTYLYVDSYVLDKFRGQVHQGVHITQLALVKQMQKIPIPSQDPKYILRPESRLRALAITQLKGCKHFKHFRIFHDYFQSYRDIFAKFALRELRSRTPINQRQLQAAENHWQSHFQDLDFQVAQRAVTYARAQVPWDTPPEALAAFIAQLPEVADREIAQMNLPPQQPLTLEEVEQEARRQWQWHFTTLIPKDSENPPPSKAEEPKVFGIGLSRTGTKSLTSALRILGLQTVHYPDDETTLRELVQGNYKFSLLEQFDAITDITVSAFYPQLDRLYPHSKFILTLRDKEEWLDSLERHWQGRPAFSDEQENPHHATHMHIRRLLRSAVYGCYEFNADRMAYVYDAHVRSVLDYFRDRPQDLLVLNICDGEGWEKLCPFLGKSLVPTPFPFIKKQSALKALTLDPILT
jgi:hypothetical protein